MGTILATGQKFMPTLVRCLENCRAVFARARDLSLFGRMLTLACAALVIFAGTVWSPSGANAQSGVGPRPIRPQLKTPPTGTRVNVDADKITYDQKTGIATATGNVVLTYGNYVLFARKVIYNRETDQLQAEGEVNLREPSGNVLQADIAILESKFRNGFAEHLRLLLTNDATLTAEYSKRTDGNITVYRRATYTRCKTCVTAAGTPLWELKSYEVTHDEDAKRIYHKHARLEFLGVPVFYLPYLSHPDPTAKRASGFLIPNFSFSDELGFGVETPYFWALAPNYDLTILPKVVTEQGPVLRAKWRHRLAKGQYSVDAGGAYQGALRKVAKPGNDMRFRGFIRTDGEFQINGNWHWGWDVTQVSDDTYMRRYKIDSRTDLENVVHVTGVDDRNFFTARVYQFQGLLTTDPDSIFPVAAPFIEHNYVFEQPVFGGELGVDTNIYGIYRDRANTPFTTVNQGTDQARGIVNVHWQRQFINGIGQVITPFGSVRGDVYVTNNVPDPAVGVGVRGDEVTGRVLPTGGIDIRWPFIRNDDFAQHIFTPVAQVIASTNETDSNRIGNEDAISLNFDSSSVFLHDRFTGLDRFEGGTRANVGFLYSLLMPNGSYLRASFGESFHIAGRNSFAAGSGLNSDESDLVAAIAVQPLDNVRATYQVRVDEQSLNVRTQEASLSFDVNRLSANVNYVDIDAEPNFGRPVGQEQVWFNGNLDLIHGWSLFGGLRYDLGLNRQVRNVIGIGFDCDCFNVKLFYSEDFTSDGDAEANRSVLLQVEFKTLGSTTIGSGL